MRPRFPSSGHFVRTQKESGYGIRGHTPQHLSAASKRALRYTRGPEWFCQFREYNLAGDLRYEEGVIRRDPSAVIKIEGTFYVWYTKGEGPTAGFGTGDPSKKVFPWDLTQVWYAASQDGWDWQEQGLAVGRGPEGAYDDRSVFTPEIFVHEEKFYLVYQTVRAPYVVRVKNSVGMAISDSPHGPWEKLPEPILRPADNGQWLGDEDDRFQVVSKGDFDSHKVMTRVWCITETSSTCTTKGSRWAKRMHP